MPASFYTNKFADHHAHGILVMAAVEVLVQNIMTVFYAHQYTNLLDTSFEMCFQLWLWGFEKHSFQSTSQAQSNLTFC